MVGRQLMLIFAGLLHYSLQCLLDCQISGPLTAVGLFNYQLVVYLWRSLSHCVWPNSLEICVTIYMICQYLWIVSGDA